MPNKKNKHVKGRYLRTNSEDSFYHCDEPHVLRPYMDEIGSDLLTHEDEIDLVDKIKQGDEDAKKRLITSNLKYVITVAKRYQNQGLPLEDLISEGNFGLMDAVDRYDARRGRFTSYAVWWIKQSISKAIAEQSRTIRIPSNVNNSLECLRKTEEELYKNKHSSRINDLAKLMYEDPQEVSNLVRWSKMSSVSSLDVPVFEDELETVANQVPEETGYSNPETIEYEHGLSEAISLSLSYLDKKSKRILELRYGLDGGEPLSLIDTVIQLSFEKIYNETGKPFSKERVRQIQVKAVETLKEYSNPAYSATYPNLKEFW